MDSTDKNKRNFITESENCCYKGMSFGLKYVGATYKHLMNKVFESQIGRTVEVYMGDMVVD